MFTQAFYSDRMAYNDHAFMQTGIKIPSAETVAKFN